MTKSKRLLELMMTINRKRKFTVKELASLFGVSSRTILRDLQELSELGVPLYSEVGPHGGYQVLNERVLPPISFTEGEALSVFFAIYALRHYASLPFASESSSALQKFFSFLPNDLKDRIDQMKNRVDFLVPKRKQTSTHLESLLEAAIEKKIVKIKYVSGNGTSERDILPIGIYADSGFWFCPAYCFLKRDYRLFRTDRIRSVSDSSFRTENLELDPVDLTNWVSYHSRNKERVLYVIELSATGIQQYEEEAWLWPMPELEKKSDGKGVIRGSIPKEELRYFSTHWFMYGKHALIKEPVELAEEVRKRFAEALHQYEKTMS
jgi:predicted DNA-binding transcriptional regulator YafY